MIKNKKDILIITLIAVIAVLLILFSFFFVVRPAINAQVIEGYNQGQIDTVNIILSSIQQNGFVQIPAGENQTIILIPYQPGNASLAE